MKLSSSAFKDNELIPSMYTCHGSNISPPLNISEVPDGTKSLALIMDDPDAPGGVFTHWLVWNINPQTGEIEEGMNPDNSSRGINSAGDMSYYGPCPPSGTHHYHFKIFALDTVLDLETGSDRTALEESIKNHTIDQTELVGLYSSNA